MQLPPGSAIPRLGMRLCRGRDQVALRVARAGWQGFEAPLLPGLRVTPALEGVIDPHHWSSKGALLFLKKKKQKDFGSRGPKCRGRTGPKEQEFFGSFF